MSALDKAFFYKTERTFVFMDGQNNYQAAKALNMDIDYLKLFVGLRALTQLIRIYYYTPVVGGEEYSSIRPLLDWLEYNNYTVVSKPIKEFTAEDGNRRTKANLDVELTLDAQRLALQDKMDHMVLLSGNGDYRPLVQAVQYSGVRVTVISTKATQPPFVADELRRIADQFLDLKDLDIDTGRLRSQT